MKRRVMIALLGAFFTVSTLFVAAMPAIVVRVYYGEFAIIFTVLAIASFVPAFVAGSLLMRLRKRQKPLASAEGAVALILFTFSAFTVLPFVHGLAHFPCGSAHAEFSCLPSSAWGSGSRYSVFYCSGCTRGSTSSPICTSRWPRCCSLERICMTLLVSCSCSANRVSATKLAGKTCTSYVSEIRLPLRSFLRRSEQPEPKSVRVRRADCSGNMGRLSRPLNSSSNWFHQTMR